MWQYLSEHLKDDEGTPPGAKPSNRSNRFEVADRINALLSLDAKKAGPFWCASEAAACQYLPQKRPPEPFQTAQGYVVRGLRLTDKRARSGSPFRLFGTASVGSQSLTGIAHLHRLRNDPKLASVSAVWPFETGWAAKAKWLPAHVLILHAEIYPSVRDPLPDAEQCRRDGEAERPPQYGWRVSLHTTLSGGEPGSSTTPLAARRSTAAVPPAS